jgi:hypothetical protein
MSAPMSAPICITAAMAARGTPRQWGHGEWPAMAAAAGGKPHPPLSICVFLHPSPSVSSSTPLHLCLPPPLLKPHPPAPMARPKRCPSERRRQPARPLDAAAKAAHVARESRARLAPPETRIMTAPGASLAPAQARGEVLHPRRDLLHHQALQAAKQLVLVRVLPRLDCTLPCVGMRRVGRRGGAGRRSGRLAVVARGAGRRL